MAVSEPKPVRRFSSILALHTQGLITPCQLERVLLAVMHAPDDVERIPHDRVRRHMVALQDPPDASLRQALTTDPYLFPLLSPHEMMQGGLAMFFLAVCVAGVSAFLWLGGGPPQVPSCFAYLLLS
jgi:hypothetical protein